MAWLSGATHDVLPTLDSLPDNPVEAQDPAAAAAGLLIVLGGYWGARQEETKERRQKQHQL